MSRGYLIVFTGIDGSGKTTQAKLLVKNLKNEGLNVSYVYSRWKQLSLRHLIRIWKSNITKSLSESGAKKDNNIIKRKKQKLLNNPIFRWLWLISFFIDYGLQIFIKIRIKLFRNRLIVSDRIFYDSIIDQAVNLGERKNLLLDCLDSFWMKVFFPKPDIVIYIDCPEDIAFSRKNDTPDIEYLTERRRLYIKLADKYGWIKIDGTLPLDEVAVKIKNTFYNQLSILKCQKL